MDFLLYCLVRAAVGIIQSLPLSWVVRLGRTAGLAAYWIDVRHRRVAVKNLEQSLGLEKSHREIIALARENYRRIGENFACAAKTASMTIEELGAVVEFVGTESILPRPAEGPHPCRVVAIGHFGNFELYARFGQFMPAFQCATTYRGLRQPSLTRLVQSLRQKSGCLFFERRTDAAALKGAMSRGGMMLGLLSDQHAGDSGLRLPFLGRDCSTTTAPAIFALRYRCPLFTAICYRVGPGRWRIEAGPEIPVFVEGKPRPIEDITLDINRAFEVAVRRDPANWFWVHNRWKKSGRPAGKSRYPAALVESATGHPASQIEVGKGASGL